MKSLAAWWHQTRWLNVLLAVLRRRYFSSSGWSTAFLSKKKKRTWFCMCIHKIIKCTHHMLPMVLTSAVLPKSWVCPTTRIFFNSSFCICKWRIYFHKANTLRCWHWHCFRTYWVIVEMVSSVTAASLGEREQQSTWSWPSNESQLILSSPLSCARGNIKDP